MSALFVAIRDGIRLCEPASPTVVLQRAWMEADNAGQARVYISPVGRASVLVLERGNDRTDCRAIPRGRRLNYREALSYLEAIPDAL